METYQIIRFFENGKKELIKEGLTLEEAQEHCQDESTHGTDEKGIRFFDGYKENGRKRYNDNSLSRSLSSIY